MGEIIDRTSDGITIPSIMGPKADECSGIFISTDKSSSTVFDLRHSTIRRLSYVGQFNDFPRRRALVSASRFVAQGHVPLHGQRADPERRIVRVKRAEEARGETMRRLTHAAPKPWPTSVTLS